MTRIPQTTVAVLLVATSMTTLLVASHASDSPATAQGPSPTTPPPPTASPVPTLVPTPTPTTAAPTVSPSPAITEMVFSDCFAGCPVEVPDTGGLPAGSERPEIPVFAVLLVGGLAMAAAGVVRVRH